MKRFLIIILVLCSVEAFSQVKLGVKLSPSFVVNRIKCDSDTLNVTKNGTGFRPSFGLIAEFPLAATYTFATGVTYMSKTVKIKLDALNAAPFSQEYIVQFIQIPLTVKLYTNEISIDKKLYFQTGFNAEIQVYNENKTGGEDAIEKFTVFDFPILFSGGMDMNLGTNTILFFGVTYQRGLINISNEENFESKAFSIKNDILGFDIGLKF